MTYHKSFGAYLLIMIGLIALLIYGVDAISINQESPNKDRFELENVTSQISILTDTRTNTEYLVFMTSMGTGITKLDP